MSTPKIPAALILKKGKESHVSDYHQLLTKIDVLNSNVQGLQIDVTRLAARDEEHDRIVRRLDEVDFQGLANNLEKVVDNLSEVTRDLNAYRLESSDRLAKVEGRVANIETEEKKALLRSYVAAVLALAAAVAQVAQAMAQGAP